MSKDREAWGSIQTVVVITSPISLTKKYEAMTLLHSRASKQTTLTIVISLLSLLDLVEV